MVRPLRSGDRIAIAVGGGPAPGINGVICAATAEAENCGLIVLGIMEGFRWLVDGKLNRQHIRRLTTGDIGNLHALGGSLLATSRTNPGDSPERLRNVLHTLKKLEVRALVTIGGDDTILSARRLHRAARGALAFVHVGKTIDNDLPLPRGVPTFGFETARHYGVDIVKRLIVDAHATRRHWHLVVTMGRGAGHLALGIGKGASAHLTIIPEEFRRSLHLREVCDIIEGAIVKRRADGKHYGVCVLAEGLLLRMPRSHLEDIFGSDRIAYDSFGNLRLENLDLGGAIRDELRRRFDGRNPPSFVHKTIGYELRSAEPIASDQIYTRNLGYTAVRALVDGFSGILATFSGQQRQHIPFEKLPWRGDRLCPRLVNTASDSYQVALRSMTRLSPADNTPERLRQLAHAAGVSAGEFTRRFEHLLRG